MPVRAIGEVLNPQDLLGGVGRVEAASPSGQTLGRRADGTDGVVQDPRARDRWLSEVNLQRLPFARLWDKSTGSMEPIVVVETEIRDGQTVRRRWQVIPGSKMGMPGPSAYATFRALEKIVLRRTIARSVPLANPQEFELQEICRELDLSYQGKTCRQIKQDLRRIAHAKCVDEGFIRWKLRDAGERPRRAVRRASKEEVFSIISRLVFRHEELPDGTVARSNLAWFDDLYLASVNSGYVKPLDWELWKSLERPAARRLYELFDLRMFATPRAEVVEFDYEQLAQLLPIKVEKHVSRARERLDRVVETVQNGGVVAGWDWREDGMIWTLLLRPAEGYRRGLIARVRPTPDPRAVELAEELRDAKSLALFNRIVTAVPRTYVDMALSETRMQTRTREGGIANAAAYFVTTLAGILQRRGLPVPFEVGAGAEKLKLLSPKGVT